VVDIGLLAAADADDKSKVEERARSLSASLPLTSQRIVLCYLGPRLIRVEDYSMSSLAEQIGSVRRRLTPIWSRHSDPI
jgi:hypothetical protein